MSHRARLWGAVVSVLLCIAGAPNDARGQTPAASPPPIDSSLTPGPPGPYVIDLRGTTLGVPSQEAFFPPLVADSAVPARGFGFDVGAHVYPFGFGPAQIGFGVNLYRARATVRDPDVTATLTSLAPQISFNFGSAGGWSYLSAGYGLGSVRTHTAEPATEGDATDADSGQVGTLNIGGGARWFLRDRVAVSFDVRMHRLGAGESRPAATVVSTSVGLSIR